MSRRSAKRKHAWKTSAKNESRRNLRHLRRVEVGEEAEVELEDKSEKVVGEAEAAAEAEVDRPPGEAGEVAAVEAAAEEGGGVVAGGEEEEE